MSAEPDLRGLDGGADGRFSNRCAVADRELTGRLGVRAGGCLVSHPIQFSSRDHIGLHPFRTAIRLTGFRARAVRCSTEP